MPNVQGLLALGQIAFSACLRLAREVGILPSNLRPTFQHGAIYELLEGKFLAVSYHPSARNTYTELLTMEIMINLLEQVRKCLK